MLKIKGNIISKKNYVSNLEKYEFYTFNMNFYILVYFYIQTELKQL